jgi:hypothetical protein
MGALRGQVGWVLRGRAHTMGALDSLTRDLQELQHKVAGLERAIADLQRADHELGARQLDEFDRVRAAVAAVTDDLAARVDATRAELRAQRTAGA